MAANFVIEELDRGQCAAPGCTSKWKHGGKCGKHYQRWRTHGSYDLPIKNRPRQKTCSVDGCSLSSRTILGRYCEMHYGRLRRNGNFDAPLRGRWSPNGDGYIVGYMPSHPMASSGGVISQHRMILFDHIGDGNHECHWCKRDIRWRATGPSKLVVDHLDGVKSNNEPNNLVPSCHRCNSTRGLFQAWVAEHKDDPLLWAMYEVARQLA